MTVHLNTCQSKRKICFFFFTNSSEEEYVKIFSTVHSNVEKILPNLQHTVVFDQTCQYVFCTHQFFSTMNYVLSTKVYLKKKARNKKCTKILRGTNTQQFTKSWEVWYIMVVLTPYIWTKFYSLQKLPFPPKAPVCTESSHLHRITL